MYILLKAIIQSLGKSIAASETLFAIPRIRYISHASFRRDDFERSSPERNAVENWGEKRFIHHQFCNCFSPKVFRELYSTRKAIVRSNVFVTLVCAAIVIKTLRDASAIVILEGKNFLNDSSATL